MRAIGARLSLLVLLVATTATAADPPAQNLADGRTGKIYFEPFRRAVIEDQTRFAAHAPLYPACNSWQVSEHVTGANRRAPTWT